MNFNPALDKTIHLTDPSPHLVETGYGAMVKELTGKVPKGRFPRKLAEKGLTWKQLQRKLGVEVEPIDNKT